MLVAPPLPKEGFAEKVAAPAAGSVVPVPDEMPYPAAMHIVYQTAYVGLHRRAVLEGDTVLVHPRAAAWAPRQSR